MNREKKAGLHVFRVDRDLFAEVYVSGVLDLSEKAILSQRRRLRVLIKREPVGSNLLPMWHEGDYAGRIL